MTQGTSLLGVTKTILALQGFPVPVPGHSFFFFLINFLFKDNFFTEFCCFLSNLNMNQPQVYIWPLPLEPPSHLPLHHSPLG